MSKSASFDRARKELNSDCWETSKELRGVARSGLTCDCVLGMTDEGCNSRMSSYEFWVIAELAVSSAGSTQRDGSRERVRRFNAIMAARGIHWRLFVEIHNGNQAGQILLSISRKQHLRYTLRQPDQGLWYMVGIRVREGLFGNSISYRNNRGQLAKKT